MAEGSQEYTVQGNLKAPPRRKILEAWKNVRIDVIKSSFNPITYGGGGGGGLFGPDHQIIDHNSKTALSSTSKPGDFLFLSIRHILAEF